MESEISQTRKDKYCAMHSRKIPGTVALVETGRGRAAPGAGDGHGDRDGDRDGERVFSGDGAVVWEEERTVGTDGGGAVAPCECARCAAELWLSCQILCVFCHHLKIYI